LYLPTTIPVGPAGFAKLQVTTPYTPVPSHNNSCWPGRFCKAAGHNSIHSCTFPQQFLLARQVLQSCRSQLHTHLYLPTTIPAGPAGFAKLQVTTSYTLYLPTTIPVSPAGFAKLQVTTPYTLVPSHNNSC